MTAKEVELSGGAPWGFRMHGGADHNQPLRISRVNPGRKASLSGIREGDVISSINGRPTRTMSNAEAHEMLRSAGPLLRLGLNEDREMSPRRRSIGKGSELKRPSQLISEVWSGKTTSQAPVYATIRPSQSPQRMASSSSMRSSLNSLPAALNSTHLVKSIASNEEPLRFHPTNPFYTTLSSNYSRLPVPNGRMSFSSLDRNRSKKKHDIIYDNCNSESISPTHNAKTLDSVHTSLPYTIYNNAENTNGHKTNAAKPLIFDKKDYNSYGGKYNQSHNQNFPSDRKNPFETKRNSDPFEKYLRTENGVNGKCEYDGKTMPSSISDSNFRSKEEITKRSTITEHEINEVEEVKTIKKIVLNGYGRSTDSLRKMNHKPSSPMDKDKVSEFNYHRSQSAKESLDAKLTPVTSNLQGSNYFSSSFDQEREEIYIPSINTYHPSQKKTKNYSAEAPGSEVVTANPLVKSPNITYSAIVQSPSKRE